MGDARRERWRAHRQARRAQFVDATILAIDKHGPDVGMDEIAAMAGVSKPVIYRHFEDKADLYLAVGSRATDMLMARIGPALADEGSVWERIHRGVAAYLGFIADYPDLYRFVVFRPHPAKQDLVQRDKSRIAAVLVDLMTTYLDLFHLDTTCAGPSAYGIVGLVQGAGEWWLDHQETMSREGLTQHLTMLIWHGVDAVLRAGGVVIDPHKPLSSTSSAWLITST